MCVKFYQMTFSRWCTMNRDLLDAERETCRYCGGDSRIDCISAPAVCEIRKTYDNLVKSEAEKLAKWIGKPVSIVPMI